MEIITQQLNSNFYDHLLFSIKKLIFYMHTFFFMHSLNYEVVIFQTLILEEWKLSKRLFINIFNSSNFHSDLFINFFSKFLH